MIIVLIAVVTTLLITLRFYLLKYSYFESRGIAGPAPSLVLGNLITVSRHDNPIPLQLRKWTQEYGKVYGFYEGIRRVLVISDVDMLHELFVSKYENFYGRKNSVFVGDVDKDPRVHVFEARGARWKRLRTLSAQAFSVSSLKKIRPTVEDSALEMMRLLDEEPVGEPVNILEFFQEYTMDVISRVAMGQSDSRMFRNKYTKSILAIFNRNNTNPWFFTANAIPALAPVVKKALMLTGKVFGTVPFVEFMEAVTRAVEQRIQDRAAGIIQTEGSTDFIDLFLDAKVDEAVQESLEYSKNNLQVSRSMTKEEVVAQCFVFLLAGFDTTANSLSYATYHISQNPRVLTKLHDEIDTICTDEEISYETLGKLSYLDMVVKEALRMYPLAAFANSRECMVPTTLGDVPIEKGVFVMADPWTMHYDKKIWGDDADEFSPERWDSSERRPLPSWFPFGIGPRQCVGMRLALMEEKLAMAHLLRRYHIRSGRNTEKSLTLVGCFTTSPKEVNVYLEKR